MASHRSRRQGFPTPLVLVSLIGILAACGRPMARLEEETVATQLQTINPEMVLTLTAWPTPPPILTQPPTATAAPQPLWTASPWPTSNSPTPTPPMSENTSSPEEMAITPAPLGSKPPAAQILIPKLELDAPVVEVSWDIRFDGESWQSVWQTAEGAAGHHRNSANPGEAGNVVLSGHHNSRGEVFRQVSEIGQPGSNFDVGDEIILVAQDGWRYTYVVVDWDRFREEGVPAEEQRAHGHYLAQTSDATLTLVTCWPYEGNSHRVVVVAKLQKL